VIQIRTALHIVERLVETLFARDVQRVIGARIDQRTAIERREKFAVFVGKQQLGAFTEPGQRRGDQGFTMGAEVAPIIFFRGCFRQVLTVVRRKCGG